MKLPADLTNPRALFVYDAFTLTLDKVPTEH